MGVDVDRLVADTEACAAALERGAVDEVPIPRIAWLSE